MQISISKGSNTVFIPLEVKSIEDVAQAALNYNVSMGVYEKNYRTINNFKEASFVGLDIDEGMSIDEAKEAFSEYTHAILPTRSHQKEKVMDSGIVKPACDRFRVFLQLESPIVDQNDFYETWGEVKSKFNAVDPQTKDPSRQFYKSTEIVSVNKTGKKVSVKKWVKPEPRKEAPEGIKGELAKSSLKFLSLGASAGSRRNTLYKVLRDMYQNNYTPDECRGLVYDICIKIGIEDKDIDHTIKSAFSKDPRHDARIEDNVFSPMTVDSLYKSKEDKLEWILDGLLPRGACSIIAGPPKAGKSTLIRQLCASVAMAETQFLNRKVTKGKVLYLALEEQREVLKEEYKKLGIKGDNFYVFVGAINKETIFKSMREFITSNKIDLVIIDTLMVFSSIQNANDYKETYAAMTEIRELARDTGCHIMTVHHTNKSEFQGANSIMGSSAFLGGVDVAIIFKALGDRRYIQSLQRPGKPFIGEELIYDKKTSKYSIGKKAKSEESKF